MEGLCYECAKKQGINPLDALAKQANLSDSDLENMSMQFESMFNDMSENPDLNFEDSENSDNSNSLGSIFSGLFGNSHDTEQSARNSNKKVKTEKKQNKKHKALDNFDVQNTEDSKINALTKSIKNYLKFSEFTCRMMLVNALLDKYQ